MHSSTITIIYQNYLCFLELGELRTYDDSLCSQMLSNHCLPSRAAIL